MDTDEPASLASSLLEWVHSFSPNSPAQSWRDLSDGQTLWTILQAIDGDYFSGALPEPHVSPSAEWTRKWQNLKHVDKQLAIYYRDICDGQDAKTSATPDLKAIAEDADTAELEKLIMVIIRASMASPESNQRMAQRLMGLGRERAMVVANELRAMEETDEEELGEQELEDGGIGEESSHVSGAEEQQQAQAQMQANGHKGSGAGLYRDPLLEREEELLQAQATIEQLQANNARMQSQLHELRQDKERLQEAFDAYREEIDSKGRKHTGEDAFKKLQRQAENDRAYIDDLESQLQGSRASVEKYERQLEKLRSANEESQKLRDDLQLLRAENEDLSQKLKANENLKRKIQTLQESEKANATLRDDLKHANDRLEQLDRVKQAQKNLEKEIIEKGGLIRNQEYQITELTTTRKHALYDAEVLAKKLDAARERHEADHERMAELADKLAQLGTDDATAAAKSFEEKQEDHTEPSGPKIQPGGDDETHHLTEKLALLQQQLEAADTRFKQASQRASELEEASRASQNDHDAETAHRLQSQDSTIAALREELETATTQRPRQPVATAATAQQDAGALQRENRLVATAWFELSARLQRNDVGLGRRRQEPKSWIGRQRAMVGPGSGAGGVSA
ncbi:hypothetical protein MBLNU230_g6468t1 [Neophaeotheca triangularis]